MSLRAPPAGDCACRSRWGPELYGAATGRVEAYALRLVLAPYALVGRAARIDAGHACDLGPGAARRAVLR